MASINDARCGIRLTKYQLIQHCLASIFDATPGVKMSPHSIGRQSNAQLWLIVLQVMRGKQLPRTSIHELLSCLSFFNFFLSLEGGNKLSDDLLELGVNLRGDETLLGDALNDVGVGGLEEGGELLLELGDL